MNTKDMLPGHANRVERLAKDKEGRVTIDETQTSAAGSRRRVRRWW